MSRLASIERGLRMSPRTQSGPYQFGLKNRFSVRLVESGPTAFTYLWSERMAPGCSFSPFLEDLL